MKAILVHDKKLWNEFIFSHDLPDGGFLQSYEWGEFQESYGRKVFRVGVAEKQQLVAGWQVFIQEVPMFGKYVYIPRPVISPGLPVPRYSSLVTRLKEIAKEQKAFFIRIDGAKDAAHLHFRPARYSIQPREELVLDISLTPDVLSAAMKPKTRYNIKVAEKHQVKIRVASDKVQDKDFESFYSLVEKTSQRQKIRPHPKTYYQKMFEVLGQRLVLYIAEHDGIEVAAQTVLTLGGTATYLHGGSDDNYKHLMAPYLMQWQAIMDAQAQGITRYNFGGVSETNPHWSGITRFKHGFSPKTAFVDYGLVWDLPLALIKYKMYTVIKKLRGKV